MNILHKNLPLTISSLERVLKSWKDFYPNRECYLIVSPENRFFAKDVFKNSPDILKHSYIVNHYITDIWFLTDIPPEDGPNELEHKEWKERHKEEYKAAKERLNEQFKNDGVLI